MPVDGYYQTLEVTEKMTLGTPGTSVPFSNIRLPVSNDTSYECSLQCTSSALQDGATPTAINVPGARIVSYKTADNAATTAWEVVYHGKVLANAPASNPTELTVNGGNPGTPGDPAVPILGYSQFHGGGINESSKVDMVGDEANPTAGPVGGDAVQNTRVYVSLASNGDDSLGNPTPTNCPTMVTGSIDCTNAGAGETGAKITINTFGGTAPETCWVNFMVVVGITTGAQANGASVSSNPTLISA